MKLQARELDGMDGGWKVTGIAVYGKVKQIHLKPSVGEGTMEIVVQEPDGKLEQIEISCELVENDFDAIKDASILFTLIHQYKYFKPTDHGTFKGRAILHVLDGPRAGKTFVSTYGVRN